jgi:hypothetical protein
LSGKYGTIPALPGFSANYTDKYASLNPSDPAFFGDKSIVLHYANKTRIACANFQMINKKFGSSNSASNSSASSSPAGGFIGSSTATATLIVPGPTSTTGAPPAASTSGAKPSASALSEANGVKIKHVKVILGPVLLGLACMV